MPGTTTVALETSTTITTINPTTQTTTTTTTTTTSKPTTTTSTAGTTTTIMVPTTSTTVTTTVPTSSLTSTTTTPTKTETTATVTTKDITTGTTSTTTTPATIISTTSTSTKSPSTATTITILQTTPGTTTTITNTTPTTTTKSAPTTTTTESTSTVETTTTQGGKSNASDDNKGAIIGSVAAVATLAFVAFIIYKVLQNKRRDAQEQFEMDGELREVVVATNYELAERELGGMINGSRIDGVMGKAAHGKLALFGIKQMASPEDRKEIIRYRNEALDKFIDTQRANGARGILKPDEVGKLENYVTAFRAAANMEDLIYEKVHPELQRLFKAKEESGNPISKDDNYFSDILGLDEEDVSVATGFWDNLLQSKIVNSHEALMAASGIKASQAQTEISRLSAEEGETGPELQQIVITDGLKEDQVIEMKIAVHNALDMMPIAPGNNYIDVDTVYWPTREEETYERPIRGLPEGIYAETDVDAYAVPTARTPIQKFYDLLIDKAEEHFKFAVALHEEKKVVAAELIAQRLPHIKERYDNQCEDLIEAIDVSKTKIRKALNLLDPKIVPGLEDYSAKHLDELLQNMSIDPRATILADREIVTYETLMRAISTEAKNIENLEGRLRSTFTLEPKEQKIAAELAANFNLAGWRAATTGDVKELRKWFGLKQQEQAPATTLEGAPEIGEEVMNPLHGQQVRAAQEPRVISFAEYNPQHYETIVDQPEYATGYEQGPVLYDNVVDEGDVMEQTNYDLASPSQKPKSEYPILQSPSDSIWKEGLYEVGKESDSDVAAPSAKWDNTKYDISKGPQQIRQEPTLSRDSNDWEQDLYEVGKESSDDNKPATQAVTTTKAKAVAPKTLGGMSRGGGKDDSTS